MKIKFIFLNFIFLLGCASTTSSVAISTSTLSTSVLSESSITTSQSVSSEMTTSIISSTLSSSIVATPSSSLITSTSIGSSQSSASSISSEPTGLATIWLTPMGISDASQFYSVNQSLTNALTQVKVTQAVAVYRNDATFYGMAYEAIVDGNGGPNSVRFRVGLVDGKFAALTMVSHSEHGGFGLKIIQALTIQLPDKPATMDTVITILINANANRTGITETYDGMIPAIDAMVIHYTAQIE